MIRQVEISNYLYILIMLFAFGCGSAMGQDFIDTENFGDKIAKDVVVVEFWADWNKHNQFNDLEKIKECETYRLDIMASMDVQNKYDVSAIPTVIIFDNGVEKVRFLPNIMFTLHADKKTVQNSVDTIILNKFQ
tara:strand:- start:19 stop:420 length:402 start_codon:yes stop_codon:yes gene_type:complete